MIEGGILFNNKDVYVLFFTFIKLKKKVGTD